MSVWNQAYEDFRRPYYEEEKKAKKDYDGDGKVESGSKEHAGAVHNAIQRAKGGKADGQDTRKEEAVAEGSMKQARKNVGASTCWDGYKAKGTKMKNGRQVPNCVKEEDLEEGIRDKDPEKGTEERKARLEKKRGMKMDDHPEYKKEETELEEKRGLYANIHAKRKRGGKMRKKGEEGAPTEQDFRDAAKTAKEEWEHASEVELMEGPYTITNADVKGNTPAFRNYKAGMKSKIDGKPMYQLAPHVKLANSFEPEGETIEEKKKGLYANIHAKRARGEAPAKPGDEDYPAKDAFKKAAKTAKKEHYDWRKDFDFVIEKKSDDCGCDHTPKKGVKNKITVMPEVKTEEVEQVSEADSLAAMAARREKRLKAQRKREGTTASGRDFGHDYSLSDKQQKARRDAEFKAGMKKEEVEDIEEADSLAAMAARREKRLKAQRKKMGTSATGQDFGHDYSLTAAERKKRQDKEFDAFIGRGKKKKDDKKEEVEFAGNYQGPLYAPHPDLKEGGMQGAVDSITKRAQGALQSIGVKINNKPRPTARPSAQTANTMRQNSMSNEEAVSEGKKKKDDSYLETNMKKRHANNEKARKDMEKMGTKMKNPHFEETLLDKVIKTYVSEEDYDRMKDRRMERGGVGGNQRYNSDRGVKKGPMTDAQKKKSREASSRAMDAVRASITAKYGKGALIDTKKKKDK